MVRSFLALFLTWSLTAHAAAAQGPPSMYIDSCGLGCSSGSGGGQVSCAINDVHVDEILRIRFSRPVDPVSVNAFTVFLVNINTGGVPIGVRYVDPTDPMVVVFEPSIGFDGAGNPIFGFEANTTYRIVIPGVAQGDSGPFVQSTDVPALDNQSRMQCDFNTTLGVSLLGARFCFGDGGGTPCPCGNNGGSPSGCPNSTDAHGAILEAFGTASLAHDTALLRGRHMPNASVLYFQGTQRVNGGAGLVFGDGLRCAGGTSLRLATLTNSNSWSIYPNQGAPSLSVRGQVAVPGTRTYQAWYRNSASFCTSATFNLTNGVEILWIP